MSDISAFPYVIPSPDGHFQWAEGGMTLRDYFAAKVLSGFATDVFTIRDVKRGEIAALCYEMADQMMKARVQTNA